MTVHEIVELVIRYLLNKGVKNPEMGHNERNVVEMEARRRVSPSSQLPSRAGELPSQRLVKI